MKIVTVMNYPDEANSNVMCIAFLGQALKYTECNIDIYTEKELPDSVQRFVDENAGRIAVKMQGRADFSRYGINFPESSKHHHNIGFKLFNLCQIKEPFIFIDADAFILHNLQALEKVAGNKAFTAVNHQNVPGHTSQYNFKFLNSGVQVVGNPSILDFDAIIDRYKQDRGFIIPGTDQALLFSYFKHIGYDYTHPDVGFEYNSYAMNTKFIDEEREEAISTGLDHEHPVYINHYWFKAKPWSIDCPIFKKYVVQYGEK